MAHTLLDIFRLTSDYLAGHGSESPRLDAELLAAHALGLRRIDLYLQFDRVLTGAEVGEIRELVRRRGGGEPIAYVTGARDFYSRRFTVTPAVLIPRPETETLVQCALEVARERGVTSIADLGTGSGCVAVTLALELPGAHVVAVDASQDALAVARGNAETYGVADRVTFVRGSWADALTSPVQLVVSNPPYVTSSELDGVARDIREHEPREALDGGADGLDAYRSLVSSLRSALAAEASVVLEVDPRRAAAVVALLCERFPAATTRVADDLARTARVVVARVA